MKFTAKTETELRPPLLPDGDYEADLLKAEEKTSQAGNEMIALTWCVYADNGRQHFIYDNLMPVGGFEYKVRHFCYSNGLEHEYDSEFIDAATCIKVKSAMLRIKTQKDKNGQHPDKNVVQDYIIKEDKHITAKIAAHGDAAFDNNIDIPF